MSVPIIEIVCPTCHMDVELDGKVFLSSDETICPICGRTIDLTNLYEPILIK